jgi:hypothetical protein
MPKALDWNTKTVADSDRWLFEPIPKLIRLGDFLCRAGRLDVSVSSISVKTLSRIASLVGRSYIGDRFQRPD